MLVFKEVQEKDFGDISKLIKSEEELFLVHPNGKYPFDVSQVKKLSEDRRELTVAVKDNEIIGFANLYNLEPEKSAFIGNVILEKTHRGKGLGRELVSYMLKKAYEKYDLPEVKISVFSENTAALLLYSSFGFLPYQIEERVSPLGNKTALIHMKMTRP